MKILQFVFVALLLLGSCSEDSNEVVDMRDPESVDEVATDEREANTTTPPEEPNPQAPKTSQWTYKVILVSEGNWGYQLFDAGKMVINQTSIPAVQGIQGFETQEKAAKTANFVLEKIKRGEIPPTVSQEELKSLGVLRSGN